MACPRENTGSHLITEVKSCWAGLIIQMGNHPGCPVLSVTGEVTFMLYSILVPPTSVIIGGLSFSQSQPDLRVFLPLQN